MKAGGAYVPIDPAYPADRQEYMLESSQAPVVVTAGGAARPATASATRPSSASTRDWPAIAALPARAARRSPATPSSSPT